MKRDLKPIFVNHCSASLPMNVGPLSDNNGAGGPFVTNRSVSLRLLTIFNAKGLVQQRLFCA